MEIQIEKRAFPVEYRVDSSAKQPKLEGYAALFNKVSEDMGGFREKIAPGAFTKTIAEGDVRALFNHDPNFVLGRTKSGTLDLEEDERGLKMSVTPPSTTWARDLMETIARGDVDQQSFAFRTIKDHWDNPAEGTPMRTLLEVQLFDVSPVTYPSYSQTSVEVRALVVDAGVDWYALSASVARCARGFELTTDKDTITAAFRVLQAYGLPEPGTTHSDEEPSTGHSLEPVIVRPMSILVRQWRLLNCGLNPSRLN